jgi:hypothetical protein
MDKLEHYLDQVCRSIGGPKSLRQHVRQELREHLLDAAAEHKAAGLPEDAALEKALEEFGKPEEVRSELEATHGHRLLPVLIDKAMQWKERTMKAKWLWMTWAYIAVVLVIALEVLFILFNVVYLIPKFQKLTHDGVIDAPAGEEAGIGWMPRFLNGLMAAVGNVSILYIVVPALAWGLFEWLVRSEHKSYIRLALLGSVAAVLMVVVTLTSGSQTVSFYLSAPAVGRLARSFAREQVASIDTEFRALEQARTEMDWQAMEAHVDRASEALDALTKGAPVMTALASGNSKVPEEELRADVRAAQDCLSEARQAIRDKDAGGVEGAMNRFEKALQPIRKAAKQPAK